MPAKMRFSATPWFSVFPAATAGSSYVVLSGAKQKYEKVQMYLLFDFKKAKINVLFLGKTYFSR